MQRSIDWGLWIAIAGLLPVAGKFLDDYHIRSSTNSKIRDKLILAFCWLDDRPIPIIGRQLAQAINTILTRIGWKIPLLIIIPVAAIAFVIWTHQPNNYGYVDAALELVAYTIFLIVFAAPAIPATVLAVVITVYFIRVLSRIQPDTVALITALLAPLIIAGLSIGLIRRILMSICDVGARPDQSPLAYGAALIGILIVIVKVTIQIVKGSAP